MTKLKFILPTLLLVALVLIGASCGGGENGKNGGSSNSERFYKKYCEIHMKLQPAQGSKWSSAWYSGFYSSFDECVEKRVEAEEVSNSKCQMSETVCLPLARGDSAVYMTLENCANEIFNVCAQVTSEGMETKSCLEFYNYATEVCNTLPSELPPEYYEFP